MLEEEAKTKWCPHVRAVLSVFEDNGDVTVPLDAPAYNRAANGKKDPELININIAKCIASNCMMWVWDLPPKFEGRKMDNPAGHCGLVNK